VRIPRRLREKLGKRGVDVAEALRRSFLKGARRLELEEVGRQLDALRERLKGKVEPYEFARIVDEERKER